MKKKEIKLLMILVKKEDFENTQIDAIVTSLIQQYEEEGIEIDGLALMSHKLHSYFLLALTKL